MLILLNLYIHNNVQSYIKQILFYTNSNNINMLNENEKEIGSTDDFIFFYTMFLVTISSLLISSVINLFFIVGKTAWLFESVVIVAIFLLTIPFNVLLDFGISFAVYIRGSSSSTNILKELLFDIIATFTIFIRFIIQNIRFIFIFIALFELFEWSFNNTNSIVLDSYINEYNIFNYSNISHDIHWNCLILNSIQLIIYYFYYTIHLIILIFMQLSVYILISIWLFFFLYTSFFLQKHEKFLIYKKFLTFN